MKDRPPIVELMIHQDNHLGAMHNLARRCNLKNQFPKPLRDNLQNLIMEGLASVPTQVRISKVLVLLEVSETYPGFESLACSVSPRFEPRDALYHSC